jgi:hypothetical protein
MAPYGKMSRYITRGHAIQREVPPGARIIRDELSQIAYVYKGTLFIMLLVEIGNSCEDCHTMWCTKTTFEMKLEDLK